MDWASFNVPNSSCLSFKSNIILFLFRPWNILLNNQWDSRRYTKIQMMMMKIVISTRSSLVLVSNICWYFNALKQLVSLLQMKQLYIVPSVMAVYTFRVEDSRCGQIVQNKLYPLLDQCCLTPMEKYMRSSKDVNGNSSDVGKDNRRAQRFQGHLFPTQKCSRLQWRIHCCSVQVRPPKEKKKSVFKGWIETMNVIEGWMGRVFSLL